MYRETEIVERHPIASRIAKADLTKTDALPQRDRGRNERRRICNSRLQRQKLEQVAKEETVRIDLARVLEQRVHQALALIEGLVKESQVAECRLPRAEDAERSDPLGPDTQRVRDEKDDTGQHAHVVAVDRPLDLPAPEGIRAPVRERECDEECDGGASHCERPRPH